MNDADANDHPLLWGHTLPGELDAPADVQRLRQHFEGIHAVQLNLTPEQAARLTTAALAEPGKVMLLEPGVAPRWAQCPETDTPCSHCPTHRVPCEAAGPERTSTAPARAFRLTLRLDADDRRSLVNALANLALRIDRGEATTGVWGSPSDGAIYEVLHDPAMTHEAYHAALRKYLDGRRASAAPADPIGTQEP